MSSVTEASTPALGKQGEKFSARKTGGWRSVQVALSQEPPSRPLLAHCRQTETRRHSRTEPRIVHQHRRRIAMSVFCFETRKIDAERKLSFSTKNCPNGCQSCTAKDLNARDSVVLALNLQRILKGGCVTKRRNRRMRERIMECHFVADLSLPLSSVTTSTLEMSSRSRNAPRSPFI